MYSNVPNRPNKVAKGFTKNFERDERLGKKRVSNPNHPDYNETKIRESGKLMLFGTLDSLARFQTGRISKIKKPHPTDNGYFKEVYVLYKNRNKYK